jgi:hypothetical protein
LKVSPVSLSVPVTDSTFLQFLIQAVLLLESSTTIVLQYDNPSSMNRPDLKHRKGMSDLSHITQQFDSLNISGSSSLSDCDNDYLHETARIASLGDDIRKEIERRFHRSKINATYVFPRITRVKPAPYPPHPALKNSHQTSETNSIRKLLKNKTSKSISHSRNSSFSRLNDSLQSQIQSNVSLNVSYQRLPTHSRNTSLSKQIPRNPKAVPKLSISLSKPKTLKLSHSPYKYKNAESRPVTRELRKGKKPVPLSLDTSLLLKTGHTKPFVNYERLY